MPGKAEIPLLLSTAEVAEVCRVKPATVLAWRSEEKLPDYGNHPGGYLFEWETVEAFLRRGIRGSPGTEEKQQIARSAIEAIVNRRRRERRSG